MAVAENQHDGAAHRLPTNDDSDTFGSRMRRARLARGWSQDQLIQRMRRAAKELDGHQLPSDRSMKAMVSRWENNWRVPDKYNLRVVTAALAMPEEDSPRGFQSRNPNTPAPH